jgi:hypothetical protein
MVATFDDFAWAPAGQADPTQTLVLATTAGTTSASGTSPWSRHFITATAPRDYETSTGLLWKQAAYAAVGLKLSQATAGAQQMLGWAQFEITPSNPTGSYGPTAYSPARALEAVVHPDRLNYVTNPSFEVSPGGWSAIGTKVTT